MVRLRRHINRRDFLGGVAGAAAGITIPHMSTETLLAAIPRKNNIVKLFKDIHSKLIERRTSGRQSYINHPRWRSCMKKIKTTRMYMNNHGRHQIKNRQIICRNRFKHIARNELVQMPINEISKKHIASYISLRQKEGASNGTINLEAILLKLWCQRLWSGNCCLRISCRV